MTTNDRRTFNRVDFERARAGWAEGEFDPGWEPWRLMAAERGIISPPTGTKWDQSDDEAPSQRAILFRTIEDADTLVRRGRARTDTILGRAILASRSWREVVDRLISGYADMRDERETEELERIREADELAAGRREAKQVLQRIGSILDQREAGQGEPDEKREVTAP